jgi:DNA-binding Lrp family transcriptional regulator
MVSDPSGPSREASGSLDDRVLSALQGLPGRLAFNGLRRALGAHPESLSRSLRRLEREGLVERVDGGYRALASAPGTTGRELPALRSIASVGLPPGTQPETVLGRLAGRWFGGLRWIGVVERPDGRLLGWTRRDGSSPVLVSVRAGVLHVLVPEDATAPDDDNESEDAAYELLLHAVGALRSAPDGAGPSVLGFTEPATSPSFDRSDN